jgi:DNA-binding NarL/FixJ family response regulator
MAADPQLPIRVAMAGGHPAVRGVVAMACTDDDLELVEDTPAVGALAELCARARPDVLVLDVDGATDGLSGLRDLRAHGPDTAVLMLSDRTEGTAVLDALKLGVRGYLSKADGLRTVGDAIRRIATGERVVAPAFEAAAVSALGVFARHTREGTEVESSLTPREREILSRICEGLTMQQVGRRLSISPRTVETHVAKLYRKLGVRTRVQAVARASQLGLLED